MKLLHPGLALGLLLSCGACNYAGGTVWRSPDWPEARNKLGRVALIIPESPRGTRESLLAATETVLGEIPAVELVDAKQLATTWATDSNDSESMEQRFLLEAQALGLDTICVLSVDRFHTVIWLALALPPIDSSNRIEYELQIFDVRSNKLLLSSRRQRIRRGFPTRQLTGQLVDDFATDLETVLAEQPEKTKGVGDSTLDNSILKEAADSNF